MREDFSRFSGKDGWEVALVDLRTPRFKNDEKCQSLAFFANICDVSIYENDMRPVLTVVHRPAGHVNTQKPLIITVDTPRYVKVTDHTIEYIKIYLLDETGHPTPFENESLRCTLHLRPTSS
jgi:hypothetical protein